MCYIPSHYCICKLVVRIQCWMVHAWCGRNMIIVSYSWWFGSIIVVSWEYRKPVFHQLSRGKNSFESLTSVAKAWCLITHLHNVWPSPSKNTPLHLAQSKPWLHAESISNGQCLCISTLIASDKVLMQSLFAVWGGVTRQGTHLSVGHQTYKFGQIAAATCDQVGWLDMNITLWIHLNDNPW